MYYTEVHSWTSDFVSELGCICYYLKAYTTKTLMTKTCQKTKNGRPEHLGACSQAWKLLPPSRQGTSKHYSKFSQFLMANSSDIHPIAECNTLVWFMVSICSEHIIWCSHPLDIAMDQNVAVTSAKINSSVATPQSVVIRRFKFWYSLKSF